MTNADENEVFHVESDGTVVVPSFRLPVSAALSEQSAQAQAKLLNAPVSSDIVAIYNISDEAFFKATIDKLRVGVDQGIRVLSDRLLKEFTVDIDATTVAGVHVEIFTPANCDPDRVLINLHGGAFFLDSIHLSRVESIPVAYMMGMKVISIHYRQGYEYKHPAALDDLVAVYSHFLERHASDRILIYGGSAGGILSYQAALRFHADGLPMPAALGIFCAGGYSFGDSDYFNAISTNKSPPYAPMQGCYASRMGYFSEVSIDDPFVNPAVADPAVLAKYPPSMILTATRAIDMSPALAVHRTLRRVGAESDLHVFDGLDHCFYYNATLPEARDAYDAITGFFKKHLKG